MYSAIQYGADDTVLNDRKAGQESSQEKRLRAQTENKDTNYKSATFSDKLGVQCPSIPNAKT